MTVTFDASGSSDSDGTVVRYDWDFNDDNIYEVYGAGSVPDWVFTTPGIFKVWVRVTDDDGAQSVDSVDITVNVSGNSAPTAGLTADRTGGHAPISINFDASASTDGDGSIVLYEWDFNGDGAYDSSGSSPTAANYFSVDGWYVVKLRVTDDMGAMDTTELDVTLPSEWWNFGMDQLHQRRSPFVGPQTDNVAWTKNWYVAPGDSIWSSPVVDEFGTAYIGCGDGILHALEPDGTEKWAYDIGGANHIHSTAAIGRNGEIYFGGYEDYKLHAISANGVGLWTFDTTNYSQASPMVAPDGTIYLPSGDFNFYAINPDGTEKWRFDAGNFNSSGATIGEDGTIYFGNQAYKLFALYPNGVKKWEFSVGSYILSSPAIDDEGTIYVGSSDYDFYAINPDGSEKWSYTTGNEVLSSAAIGEDGNIYVTSYDGNLYAFNPAGGVEWTFVADSGIAGSPAIDANGTIYFGSYGGILYAINPDGTELWSNDTGNNFESSPTIDSYGTIYIGGYNGTFYAFRDP